MSKYFFSHFLTIFVHGKLSTPSKITTESSLWFIITLPEQITCEHVQQISELFIRIIIKTFWI